MVNCINLIIEMSPRFILGRENVPCVAEVVNRSLKADCTDYTHETTENRWKLGENSWNFNIEIAVFLTFKYEALDAQLKLQNFVRGYNFISETPVASFK